MKLMKKSISLLTVGCLAIGLSACGPKIDSEVTNSENAPVSKSQSDEKPEEKPDKQEAQRPTFGQTVTYDDGLKLTISEGTEYQPDEFAAGIEGEGTPLKFNVAIENDRDQDFDPTLISVTLSSGGKEVEQIFDSANGIGEYPSTTVLPAKSISWDIAFKVPDPNDMVMDVSVMDDFNRAEVTYVK